MPPGADTATIRAAFARRLRAVHPDGAAPGRADPGRDVADLLAARDQLLARPPTSRPHPGPVVFYQRPNLVAALRAWLPRRRQPRRHLS